MIPTLNLVGLLVGGFAYNRRGRIVGVVIGVIAVAAWCVAIALATEASVWIAGLVALANLAAGAALALGIRGVVSLLLRLTKAFSP